MATFIGATKTFTAKRTTGSTVVNGRTQSAPTTTVVASGLSIFVADKSTSLVNETGAVILSGQYIGTTFADTPVLMGDTLFDEAELDASGAPVEYGVQIVLRFPTHAKLQLKRTDVGA